MRLASASGVAAKFSTTALPSLSLGDGIVVGALVGKLALQIGDDSVLLGELSVVLGGVDGRRGHLGDGHRGGGRRVEAAETIGLQLILKVRDRVVQNIDLVGDMLEEHVHFIHIVAFAVDGEALIVDVGSGDCHVGTSVSYDVTSLTRRNAGRLNLENHHQQTYPEL